MKVSVIISTYNRKEMLHDLIAQLRGQTVPVEIVVADDGSQEPVVCGTDTFGDRMKDIIGSKW